MSSRQPQKFVQTQPKTYQVSVKAILSFPFRLCNPPPAVSKVRSCGVTPLFKLRLEDVLDRKHLPPLGLKDFEEWLLFVEMSPENLYFTLWLREYKLRFNQWKSQAAFQQSRIGPSLTWSPQHSPQLAMFYARAKQTFFTPGSEYELNLSSSLLAPFHQPNMPPHPDPEVFTEIAIETYRTLDESLRRFVHAQFNNVGNSRVLCGMIGGLFFSLLGTVPPLAMNFARGESRWPRLAALPGLWLGLTILLTSLNGICLGVYIFGDLRQLRKFELSRPPISKPKPLPAFRRHSIGTRPLSATDSVLPIQNPAISRKNSTANSVHNTNTGTGHSLNRMPSVSSDASRLSGSTSHTSSDDCGIQISPAYYDADAQDVPCALYDDEYRFPNYAPTRQAGDSSPSSSSFTATASFIHQFELSDEDEDDIDQATHLPTRHQLITPFDFDSLPRKPNFKATGNYPQALHPSAPAPTLLRDVIALRLPRPPESSAPTGFIARMQEKCNVASWRLQPGYLESADTLPTSGNMQPPSPSNSPTQQYNPYQPHPNAKEKRPISESTGADDTETKVRKRFRMINAVPAFAVPLTRVLSPVIVRGQWEIVVRSALAAFLIAWVVVGSLLAIPVRR
ncbi:hypothetical protein B0H34DRAFT_453673 [Crassisporium funariophilum]|nr:hypothetical protein B0H34DRAFT_453673 [Crassisporium funariophilum]